MSKLVFFNFAHSPKEKGGMVRTDLSFYELNKLLAGHMFSEQLASDPRVIAKNLPDTESIDTKKHPELFEFVKYLVNNDASTEKVPINKDLAFYDTGIRKSNARYKNEPVYLINLNRIKKTHTGTNTDIIASHAVRSVKKLHNKWHLPY